MFKKTLVGLALAASAVTSAFAAYPDKPVTLVVPFPPGGSTDAIARVLAQELPKKLGGTWIVDNKAGATGTIGAAFIKRAPADGYTLFVSSLGPFVIAPHLIKGVQYDALKDLDPITVAVQAPNVLVELFWQQTNTEGLHIPYKGGGPAINDLLGSQVDAAFVNINSIIQHIKGGKVRALGVASEKRNTLLPDLPTLAEQGVKGAEVQSWQAVAGPKGLPADVKTKLRDAIAAVLNDPAVKDKLVAQGFEIVADTPEHFARFQATEYARWKQLIETRKISID
jgi:tripartite-type tricarboxylate transporter receptor subunit TctC